MKSPFLFAIGLLVLVGALGWAAKGYMDLQSLGEVSTSNMRAQLEGIEGGPSVGIYAVIGAGVGLVLMLMGGTKEAKSC